jgi:hypothetical protein
MDARGLRFKRNWRVLVVWMNDHECSALQPDGDVDNFRDPLVHKAKSRYLLKPSFYRESPSAQRC